MRCNSVRSKGANAFTARGARYLFRPFFLVNYRVIKNKQTTNSITVRNTSSLSPFQSRDTAVPRQPG